MSWIADKWIDDRTMLPILVEIANSDESSPVRWGAVRAIAEMWRDDPIVLPLLQKWTYSDEGSDVRAVAISLINKYFPKAAKVFETLCNVVENDPFQRDESADEIIDSVYTANPRKRSLEALCIYYPTHPKTLELLRDRAENDPDEQLRQWAQEQLQRMENEGGET
jgi:hypothetical protein